jgi:hypothetical protein
METGIFYDRHDADEAVRLLHDLGYRNEEISVMSETVIGPLATILAGMGAGGVGGVVGALVGAGIPVDRAREIDRGLQRGGVMIGVTPRPENRRRVNEILAPVDRRHAETGELEPTEFTPDDPAIPPRRRIN